jgi:hypothetical protein
VRRELVVGQVLRRALDVLPRDVDAHRALVGRGLVDEDREARA